MHLGVAQRYTKLAFVELPLLSGVERIQPFIYLTGDAITKQKQKQKFQERLAKPDFVVRIIEIVYLPVSHPSGFQVYVGSEPILLCSNDFYLYVFFCVHSSYFIANAST